MGLAVDGAVEVGEGAADGVDGGGGDAEAEPELRGEVWAGACAGGRVSWTFGSGSGCVIDVSGTSLFLGAELGGFEGSV